MMRFAVIGAQLANLISCLVGADLLDMSMLWVTLLIHIGCAVPVAGTFMGGFESMDNTSFKIANLLVIKLIIMRLLLSTIAFFIGFLGYLIFT